MSRALSARAGYVLSAVALFAVEAVIAVFVHDRIVRPYIGDSLVVALVYCVLRAAMPLRVTAAAAAAFGIACAVEIGQYFHLIDLLGLGGNAVARALLGTFFDLHDILAYAIGALGVLAVERARVAFRPTPR